MPIQIKGVEAALKAIKGVAKDTGIKIADGLQDAAQILYDKSQELVPVDSGRLKASGQITSNNKKGLGAELTVDYGGPEAPYAFIVHELLDLHHVPPTQAKYLERAATLVKAKMQRALKRKIAVNMGSSTS
jgi:hypothetical protein